jgi:ParB family chromosome partitioning protein
VRPAPVAEEAVGVPGAQLREVAVDDVVPNPKQPRQVFDDEALDELTHSVREFGLLQPIVVRERTGSDGGPPYELIMGERRLRAAKAAGLEAVPAIVRDTTDDALLRDALLENIHRVQLNPLEEAAAYQQLLEEFGATHEELASRIGRSRSQVTNTIRLMKLPVKVQTRVAAGVLSAGHARALLGLPSSEAMDALATRIVAEGMSVRATEEAVAVAAAEEPTAKRRTRRISAPGVEDLGQRLSDVFETKVQVQIGRAKGRIVVEFGSVDDLQRIVGLMAPDITGRRADS